MDGNPKNQNISLVLSPKLLKACHKFVTDSILESNAYLAEGSTRVSLMLVPCILGRKSYVVSATPISVAASQETPPSIGPPPCWSIRGG